MGERASFELLQIRGRYRDEHWQHVVELTREFKDLWVGLRVL